jgi:hypothetical protein
VLGRESMLLLLVLRAGALLRGMRFVSSRVLVRGLTADRSSLQGTELSLLACFADHSARTRQANWSTASSLVVCIWLEASPACCPVTRQMNEPRPARLMLPAARCAAHLRAMEMRWERRRRNGLASPEPVPPVLPMSPPLVPGSFWSPGVLGPSLMETQWRTVQTDCC